MANTRRSFDPDFKAKALELMQEVGGKEAGKRLGISDTILFRWRKNAGSANPRSKYSDKFKAQAVALAAKIGIQPAMDQLGIKSRTQLDDWRRKLNGQPPRWRRRTGRPVGRPPLNRPAARVQHRLAAQHDAAVLTARASSPDVFEAYRRGIQDGIRLAHTLGAE